MSRRRTSPRRTTPRRATGSNAIRTAGIATLLLLLAAPLAWSAPPALPTTVEPFLVKLNALAEAKDNLALAPALKHLVKLHNASRSKKERTALVKAAGAVLRNKDLGSARCEAADALGRLNDDKAAFQQLSKALPSVKDRTVDALGLRVVGAIGYLAPDAGVNPLLHIAEKAADPNAAIHAVRALGGFGYSKHRARILTTLLKRSKARAPGQSRPGDRGANPELRRMWQQLSGEIVTALNVLTGRKVPDIEGWYALHKEHKKKVEKLFTRPR